MSIHRPAYEETSDMMRVLASISTLPTPTPRNINSAATTNSTNIKNTAGTLYSLVASNTRQDIWNYTTKQLHQQ